LRSASARLRRCPDTIAYPATPGCRRQAQTLEPINPRSFPPPAPARSPCMTHRRRRCGRSVLSRRFRLAARARALDAAWRWFGRRNGIFDLIQRPGMREAFLCPETIDDRQPHSSVAGVTPVVMLIECHAVLFGFIGPPRRHDVQRQPPAADVVNVRRYCFARCRGAMVRKARPDEKCTINSIFRDRRQRRRRGPGIETGA